MRATLFAAAALAAVASASVVPRDGPTPCMVDCAQNSFNSGFCSNGFTDLHCICHNSDFFSTTYRCVSDQCGGQSQVDAAQAIFSSLCQNQ
ncbi:hypothetical protein BOTBODRAFT_68163 [Botryobasidium botryosum FD-172 SS1]|uniref:CFEM domain-containing protein n=1 Tax=Botryobasidium botryosum (strain FD-172 SS1) TaxID=930990 RepID=A0A067M9A2_BOTB1|nr:hypothetical protein BOTBODRAFT_68163 [Botryobasidium botryosum FD-172 SS1]